MDPESAARNFNSFPLPRYSTCFVCGKENPIGLDITFWYKNGRIETAFTPGQKHTGYQNITHGGILATLLDECMGWSGVVSRPILCKSVELTIRYKNPAVQNQPYTIWGELVEDKTRMILTRGAVEHQDGTIICTATGKYFPMADTEIQAFQQEAGWGNALQDIHQNIQSNLDSR